MSKILYISLLLTFISCSDYYNPNLERNGLFGKVNEVKEITFRVNHSIKGAESLDTIRIRIKKYNRKGLLLTESIKFQSIDYYYLGKYYYNSDNEISKEIGKVRNQPNDIVVDYYYSDKLLTETRGYSKINDDEFDIEIFQIENYIYQKEKLIECIQNSYSVYSNSKDSILTSSYKSKFDENKFVIEVDWKLIDSNYPTSNHLYNRNSNGLIIKEKQINKINNREIIFTYKYEYDNKGSWIKKKKIENDTIKEIVERIIEYK